MAFHEDSTVDSEVIDSGKVETQFNDDSHADPEGAAQRAQAPARGAAPVWIMEEFDWRDSINRATGEVSWNLAPKRAAVENVGKQAPERLAAAVKNLEDVDKQVGLTIGKELENVMQTMEAVDQYLPEAFIRTLSDQVTQGACRVQRWRDSIINALERLEPGKEQPEWLINLQAMAAESSRRTGICYFALQHVAPTRELNYNAAAWNVMRSEAYRQQQRFLNPDQLKAKTENAGNATHALVSNL